MLRVHIARNGQQIGKFSEKEVTEGLASGRFTATDLYWHEGMSSWEQLSKFHPLHHQIDQDETKIPSEVAFQATSEHRIAWETKDRNFLLRWWDTTIYCLFNPISTFKTMPVQGGISAPLTFYIFSASLATAVMGFTQIASQVIIQSNQNGESPLLRVPSYCELPFIILLAAFFGFIAAFFCSGITHFLLGLFGAANRGFEGTFRAVCYSLGSANSLQLIPLIGTVISFFWGPVIYVISLKEAHKTDYWRVILAVILPIVFCGFILWLGLLAVVFSSFQSSGQ